jgi:hypothetical protein
VALLGSTLACGCEDGSVALFRLHKDAGVFLLYSLLRLQHVPQLSSPSQVPATRLGSPLRAASAALLL